MKDPDKDTDAPLDSVLSAHPWQRDAADTGSIVVPEGHTVHRYQVSPLPRVARSAAGVWLAYLGSSSDEQEEEFDRILSEVEALRDQPRPQLLFAAAGGPLSSLMAPRDVLISPYSGWLLWILDATALAGAPRAPALLRRLLRQMYLNARAELRQSVFALNHESSPARAVLTLIRELGIEVRMPEPSQDNLLVEVQRPEGVVISALLGAPLADAPTASAWAREVNEEKDQATADHERLSRLETDEERALEARLAPDGTVRQFPGVDRAPRLRRLLLAVLEEDDRAPSALSGLLSSFLGTTVDAEHTAAREALYKELLARDIPLLFMVDPATHEAGVSSWPGGFEALATYADMTSLLMSARDLGLPTGSYDVGAMRPADLLASMAENGGALAICVFPAPDRPMYIPIQADTVSELAARRARAD